MAHAGHARCSATDDAASGRWARAGGVFGDPQTRNNQMQAARPLFGFSLARRLGAMALAFGLLSGAALVPTASRAEGTGLPDFTELVQRVGPAVVNIRTTERVEQRGASPYGELDPDVLEFFRRFGLPIPGPQAPGPRGMPQQPDGEPRVRGVGSGFILNADGYVMTNAHVVEGADEVIVTLTDDREFKAKIIGADKRTDVALVKIEASGLPVVRTGDIERLKVGEWVIAIGSPFGLSNTVTAGIVSAKARETGEYLPFIQTDVAINPGNSGGPLINMRGEVVGINSQIYSRSGGFMGISFAIPIDEAMRVADQLRATGRVIRGRIGVQIAEVTKDVAAALGLGKPAGAMVRGVQDGGPAAKAGVEPGDIITKYDGRTVERAGDLPRLVGATKPGSKVSIQVFRRGAHRDLNVTVAELESDRPQRRADTAEPKSSTPIGALGLAVTDLSEAQRSELKVRGGVLVQSAQGAAARAGLREGDVLLAIGNREITDAAQFQNLVAQANKNEPLTVLVRRGEWVNYVVIRPAR